MKRELTLRIILEKPPAGADFGLQKGRGNTYETTQKQSSTGKDLKFEFKVGLKPSEDSMPTLLGPFVQGPATERFIYIDIGTYAGQKDTEWSRRLKIPLKGITWDMINKISAESQMVLEAHVPGTGRDGGPTCGTIKPFDGWKLVKA